MQTAFKRTAGAIALGLIVALAGTGIAYANIKDSSDKGTKIPASERYYDVIREDVPGLDATVYRPAVDRVKKDERLPILVWSNGGCRGTNEEFITLLTEVASHGFLIVADGAASTRYTDPIGRGSAAKMIQMLDSVTASKKYRNLVDGHKAAMAGQSCGARNAMVAGADPRVGAVIAMNGSSGSGTGSQTVLNALHSPTLWINGGPLDANAYSGSQRDFDAVKASVPALKVVAPNAGHVGLAHGLSDPNAVRAGLTANYQEVEVDASNFTVAWLDYTLNKNTAAGASILNGCSMCISTPAWEVAAKGFAS